MKDRNELRTRDTAQAKVFGKRATIAIVDDLIGDADAMSKAKTREQIQKDTEEFLKNGGIIKKIPMGVTAGGSKLHPYMQAIISEVEYFDIKSNKPIINNEEE